MEGLYHDELKIYRGEDIKINDGITIHQPTLGEICDYGENEYYSMVHLIASSPTDMNWQLWDMGIDYTKITDFELFSTIIVRFLDVESTKIIFGDLDFSAFELRKKSEDSDERFLYDEENDIIIDEYTYMLIMEILRKIHGFKHNVEVPANERTKKILIEDAKDQYLINKNKELHSQLLNLVSAMTNSSGFKYNHDEVWGVKINAFMDSVLRVQKIKDANLLLQSGYSGFGIDLKKLNDKSQLDWLGSLSK